jgi:hypothetical protein
MRWKSRLLAVGAGLFGCIAGTAPASARHSGGILRIFGSNIPAGLPIREKSTRCAVTPAEVARPVSLLYAGRHLPAFSGKRAEARRQKPLQRLTHGGCVAR